MIKEMHRNPIEWNLKKFYGYPEAGLEIMRYWKPGDYGTC
jgi:hypothetical protein